MRLAHTLPNAAASAARQSSSASASASSDQNDEPFGDVLEEVSGRSGRGSRSQTTSDASEGRVHPDELGTSSGALPRHFSTAFTTGAGLPDLSLQATAGDGGSSPLVDKGAASIDAAALGGSATVTLVDSSPAALAAFLSTLSAAPVKAGEGKAVSTPASSDRGRSAGRTSIASDDADQAPAPTGALANLLGIIPAVGLQVAAPLRSDSNAVGPQAAAASPALADDIGAGAAASLSAAAAAAVPPRDDPDAHKAGFEASLVSVIRSIKVETQIAPAFTPPIQQVIATVQKLVASPASSAAEPAVQVPLPASRSVTLVLEPADLGTVTVRLQLRGGSLDLHLDVANTQTLALLSKDKDSLTAAVAGQDYQVGSLTLRASDVQNISQGSDHGSRPHDQSSGGSQQNGDGAAQGQASQGGGEFSRRSRPDTPDRSDGMDEAVSQRGTGSASAPGSAGLYI